MKEVKSSKIQVPPTRNTSSDTGGQTLAAVTAMKPQQVLDMQRKVGNAATINLLKHQTPPQSADQSLMRDTDALDPLVSSNQNVRRDAMGLLEDQPQMQAVLDELLPLAHQTAAEFSAFRAGGYEQDQNMNKVAQPAQALALAALQANKSLTQLQHTADTGGLGSESEDNWLVAGAQGLLAQAHSTVSRVKFAAYLQSKLDSEELTLLQQAFGFTEAQHKGTMTALFGLPSLHIEHNYDMKLREAANWVTTPHEIIMTYTNNIGMTYEKTISLRWLGGGASLITGGVKGAVDAAKKEAKGQFQGVIDEKIDGVFGREPEFSEKVVSKKDTNDFWLPAWFEKADINQFAAFAKAEVTHVLAKGLPAGYVGVHILSFDFGAHTLTFDLSEDLFQIDPSLPEMKISTIRDIKEAVEEAVKNEAGFDADAEIDEENAQDLKKGRFSMTGLISGDVETDWDVMYKTAIRIAGQPAKKKAKELEIDFDLRSLIDPTNPAWQPLVSADIFFETGQATISPIAEAALTRAIALVRQYVEHDPQAALRFVSLGKASKLWKNLKQGENAAQNNYILSVERASVALVTMQNLRAQLLGDLLPEEIVDQTEGDADAPLIKNPQLDDVAEGLGSGDDARWQDDMSYSIEKSRDRMSRDKDDNNPYERGAMIRIAVRPTLVQAQDADAALNDRLANPTPAMMAQIVEAQARSVLETLFSPKK